MTTFFNTGLTQQQFLDEFWQKKPLLIRNAFSADANYLSPDELAGLACEEGIESRLIEEKGAEGAWQLQHGPFSEADFARLPESHWTLLVQDVEKHVPKLAAVFEPFRFIPAWRRDDLMVSYAPVGGSVGPHTDGYDVFLLQSLGTRRWQISDEPVEKPVFIDDLPLKILAQFEPDQCWDLQPGDMLYLPPHFAHHGVAQNDCMTFSIGFRAPSQIEVLDAFMQSMGEQEKGQQRYTDADLQVAENEFQIDETAINRFKHSLLQCIELNDDILISALGILLTETKPSLEWLAEEYQSEESDSASLAWHFNQGDTLLRNPYQRVAWSNIAQQPVLFAAGQHFEVSPQAQPFLALFCDKQPITAQHWQQICQQQESVELLSELVSTGCWYWQSDSD